MGDTLMSPESLVNVLKEDLGALRGALDSGSVSDIVIFANRFVSDAALFGPGTEASTELCVGAMLRIMAEDLVQTTGRRKRKSLEEEVQDLAVPFVTTVGGALPDMDQGYPKICAAYYAFEKAVSAYQLSDEEKVAYKDAPSLQGASRRALTQVLLDNAGRFSTPRSLLPEGILNEFSRLCRVHQFDEKDLCFFTGVKSFQLLNDYYRFLLAPMDGEVVPPSREEVIEEQKKVVGNLVSFVKGLDTSKEDDIWMLTRDFVAPVMHRWREMFIFYMQVQTTQVVPTLVGQAPPDEAEKGKAADKGRGR